MEPHNDRGNEVLKPDGRNGREEAKWRNLPGGPSRMKHCTYIKKALEREGGRMNGDMRQEKQMAAKRALK